MVRLRSILCSLPLIVLAAGPLSAQTANPPDSEDSPATLKISARTVVEDVVVKNKKDQTVPSLRKEDFQVFEDGKPQTITFFEPNLADAGAAVPATALPPNTFTNVPAVAPNQAINVLLMDALNTQSSDQMYVRLKMVEYLALLPPNVRAGVFMLTTKLRLIQGVTQDSTALRAAIAKFAARPSPSELLATPAQEQAQNSLMDLMERIATDTNDPYTAESASALEGFMQHESEVESNAQLLITLNSLQVLAHYLGGVPGRKNLIWFVGAIPVCMPPACPYQNLYHETQTMLGKARVSVYPIDSRGVMAPNSDVGSTSKSPSSVISPMASAASTGAPTETAGPPKEPYQFINAETWAKETGGEAFHNNDLKQDLADAIDHGSRYYTLAYVPADPKEVGRERKIEVKIPSGKYTLFYRRSYFEQTPKQIKAATSSYANDPLRPLMDRGMPSSTEIPYRLKVVPAAVQPGPGAARAGENPQLTGKLTRYTVGFQLQADSLSLAPDSDGARRRPMEVALVVYSHDGKPLNWELRNISLLIKPEQWAMAQEAGIPFHFEIDAPPGDVYLHTGIYDKTSNKSGTLEIPLSAVAVAQK